MEKLRQIEHSAVRARRNPPELGEQHIKLIIGLVKYLVTEIELCSPRR